MGEHKSKKETETREGQIKTIPPYTKLELVVGHQKWSDREMRLDNGLHHRVEPGSPALDTGLNCHRIGTECVPRNFRIGFEIGH